MAQSVNFAGAVGTNNAGVNILTTSPSYNQSGGNAILVVANSFNQAPGAISDTAANSFGSPIASFIGGNNNNVKAWVVANCAGNASNQVSVAYANATFASLWYFDISGSVLSSAVDVNQHPTTATTASSISDTITTAQANEAIISVVFQDNAALSSVTAPTGFTQSGAFPGSYSNAAYKVVTFQTGVTLSWTSIATSGASCDMLTVSIKGTSGGVTVVPMRTLMGVGV